MNSLKKFSEDELPDRCKLFSSLKDKCISEKDHLHTITLWNVFKMNTMGYYRDLFQKQTFCY